MVGGVFIGTRVEFGRKTRGVNSIYERVWAREGIEKQGISRYRDEIFMIRKRWLWVIFNAGWGVCLDLNSSELPSLGGLGVWLGAWLLGGRRGRGHWHWHRGG